MRLTFTGDILIYESQDKHCRNNDGKYNYRPIFEQIKPLLDKSDYVVGSFETTTAGKKARYTHEATCFNTPDDILSDLKWAGFNLLTTANNHCFDRGFNGHKRTIEKIKESGLEYTGTRLTPDESAFLVKDFDGTRIAFVAYTYGTNSTVNKVIVPNGKEYLINLTRPQDEPIHRPLWKKIARAILYPLLKKRNVNNIVKDCVADVEINNGRNEAFEEQMLKNISDAKNNADIVIVCLHSGGQFNSKVEGYTQHLFDIIADAGADAIICNHAHTVLPIYHYKDCLIASALGNFSFAPGEGYWVDGVMAEYSILLNLEINDKKITDYNVDFCKCVYNNNNLAITIPVNNENEIKIIKEKLIINKS